MVFNFSKKGKVNISMNKFVYELLEEYKNIDGEVNTPATKELFIINEKSECLDNSNEEYFHSGVAILMYLAKRIRRDLLTAISFLSTRVQNPTAQDMSKLEINKIY